MKLGKKVKWASSSHGFLTVKTGTIVAVLKEGERAVDYARMHLPGHRLMFDGNSPVPKYKEIYLVEVIVNNRKPALYKPAPSALRPANS